MFGQYLRLNGVLASDFTYTPPRQQRKGWKNFLYDTATTIATGEQFRFPEYSLDFVRKYHTEEEIRAIGAVRLYRSDRAAAEREFDNRTKLHVAKTLANTLKENRSGLYNTITTGTKYVAGYATGGVSNVALAAIQSALNNNPTKISPATANDLKTPIPNMLPTQLTS